MAGITLVQAQTHLDAYLAAETKILKGQAVDMDGKRLTRADLEMVQRGIDIWNGRVKQLTAESVATATAGRIRVFEVIPK